MQDNNDTLILIKAVSLLWYEHTEHFFIATALDGVGNLIISVKKNRDLSRLLTI
jgi:hypothetical protein